MSFADNVRARVAALLGVTAYQPHDAGYGPKLDERVVEQIREALGGQIQPIVVTKLRWYLADLEVCQSNADAGDLSMAAQLYRAMRRDGVIAGLLGTRTSGLVRLPKRFYGKTEIAAALRAKNGTRSVFDDMHPPSELGLVAADGVSLGVSLAERVPVPGRDFPVLIRLDPEFLTYRWAENRWYFRSVAGLLPITPGDGRWVLHTPGGRISPWNSGLWPSLGRSFINKEHAMLHRSNYSAKLANPARVAVAPNGATEAQEQRWFAQVLAWGVNTVFGMKPGYDVKLVESNGVGYEVFQKEIDTSDHEVMISIAGQVVTVTGGSGFANADIHRAIRADLIDTDGEALAYTLNTQSLPDYAVSKWGADALAEAPTVGWDTRTPKDLAAEAASLNTVAGAIKSLGEALAPYGRTLNIDELVERFGVPIAGDNDGDGIPDDGSGEVDKALIEEAKSLATKGDMSADREAA